MATGPFGKAWGIVYRIYMCRSLGQDSSSRGPGLPVNQEALDLEMSLGLVDGWQAWLSIVVTQVRFLATRSEVCPVTQIKQHFSRLPIYFILRDNIHQLPIAKSPLLLQLPCTRNSCLV